MSASHREIASEALGLSTQESHLVASPKEDFGAIVGIGIAAALGGIAWFAMVLAVVAILI